MEDGKVSFTWRNYKQGGRQQTMTLDAHEFIRRFLLHVLPDGFMRIRYYGLFANRHRAETLQQCRELLNASEVIDAAPIEEQDRGALLQSLTGRDPRLCPQCGRGRLVRLRILSPWPPFHTRAPPGVDSS
jgi:hypothetical protein